MGHLLDPGAGDRCTENYFKSALQVKFRLRELLEIFPIEYTANHLKVTRIH